MNLQAFWKDNSSKKTWMVSTLFLDNRVVKPSTRETFVYFLGAFLQISRFFLNQLHTKMKTTCKKFAITSPRGGRIVFPRIFTEVSHEYKQETRNNYLTIPHQVLVGFHWNVLDSRMLTHCLMENYWPHFAHNTCTFKGASVLNNLSRHWSLGI